MTIAQRLISALLYSTVLIMPSVWAAKGIENIEQAYKQTTGPERINALEQLTNYYTHEQPEKAKKFAFEAMTLLTQFPDLSKELAIGYSLVDTLLNLGEYELAKTYATQFNQKAKMDGNKKELAISYFSLAKVARNKDNDYLVAIGYLEQSAALFYSLNDLFSYGVSMNAIGLNYYYKAQYELAMEHYTKVLAIDEFVNSLDAATTYSNIAMIHYQYKEYDKAIQYYLQALSKVKKYGRKSRISHQSINLAIAYLFNNEIELAIKYLNEADKLEKQIGNKDNQLDINIRLGESYVAKRDFKRASEYYQKALQLSQLLNNDIRTIQIHLAIGKFHSKLEDYQQALHYTTIALDKAIKVNRLERVSEAHQNLSNIYQALSNHKLALKHLRQHFALKVKKFENARTDKIAKLEVQYKAKERKAEISSLKQRQEIADLKAQQQQYYVAGGFFLVIFAGGFAIYWQKKRTKLYAEQARMADDILQKKNQLLADVSHELGTPLTVLKLQVESLRDDDEEDVQLAYQALDNKIHDIESLIIDVHQLAQMDVGAMSFDLQPININALLDNWQKDLGQLIELSGLKWHYINKLQSEVTVNIDVSRILQVLTNLATNSARYTYTPGQVALTVKQIDKNLVLYFDDSPPSVATQHLKKIFDRLYRVEESRSRASGGSGLGLAISAGLVHSHDGEIYAQRSPIDGLRVVIKLPIIN